MAGRLDSAIYQLPDFGRVSVPTSSALETRMRIISLGEELETVPATRRMLGASDYLGSRAPLSEYTLTSQDERKMQRNNDTRPRKVARNRLQLCGIKVTPKYAGLTRTSSGRPIGWRSQGPKLAAGHKTRKESMKEGPAEPLWRDPAFLRPRGRN